MVKNKKHPFPPVLTYQERAALIELLRNGEATVAELANAAGVSRQSLQQHANKHGLNIRELREKYVKNLWKISKGGDW